MGDCFRTIFVLTVLSGVFAIHVPTMVVSKLLPEVRSQPWGVLCMLCGQYGVGRVRGKLATGHGRFRRPVDRLGFFVLFFRPRPSSR